jgi:hypothetical protein
VNVKRVLEHVVYFQHTGPRGEELPGDQQVKVWDDPYLPADDHLMAILGALKALDQPGEAVELRVRSQSSVQSPDTQLLGTLPLPRLLALVQITLEATHRYSIRISTEEVLADRATRRLVHEGFHPAVAAKGSTSWLLEEHAADFDSLPSYVDTLIGDVLGYRDDYEVEENPGGGRSV